MTDLRAFLVAVVAAVGLWLAAVPASAQMSIQFGVGAQGGQAGVTLNGQIARKAGGQCLDDMQINRAIASGQIRSWPQIRKLAGIPASYYETSDVQVCMRGGVPYYIVNMVSPKGENVKYVLNALDGSG